MREIFSEEIINRRETVRQGRWGKKHWQGKVLVIVLIFGGPSDMTRIEFERKCSEVGRGVFCTSHLRQTET